MKYIDLDGIQYAYQNSGGANDIILMIHGNPDSSDLWNDSISLLQGSYRCIAPDLPGYGDSGVDNNFDFSLNYALGWMEKFISAVGINEPIHLIIHDIGAFYGFPWAIKNPSKIKSLCVTNTLFFTDYKWHFWGRVWRTPILGEFSRFIANRWVHRYSIKWRSPKLSDDFLNKSYDKGISNPVSYKTMLNIYRAMSPSAFAKWEDEYLDLTSKVPVLVVWGERDPYIPSSFNFAERFAKGQSLKLVPDAGHWVVAEEPELFVRYWLDFVGN